MSKAILSDKLPDDSINSGYMSPEVKGKERRRMAIQTIYHVVGSRYHNMGYCERPFLGLLDVVIKYIEPYMKLMNTYNHHIFNEEPIRLGKKLDTIPYLLKNFWISDKRLGVSKFARTHDKKIKTVNYPIYPSHEPQVKIAPCSTNYIVNLYLGLLDNFDSVIPRHILQHDVEQSAVSKNYFLSKKEIAHNIHLLHKYPKQHYFWLQKCGKVSIDKYGNVTEYIGTINEYTVEHVATKLITDLTNPHKTSGSYANQWQD